MTDSERDVLLVKMSSQVGALGGQCERMAEYTSEMKEWQREQNGDIRALQKWQAKLTGAFGVVAVLVIWQDELREAITHLLGG